MWRRSAVLSVLLTMAAAQDAKTPADARAWLDLLHGEHRAKAHAALVELGAAAVPAILDALEAAEKSLQEPYCRVLIDMGQAASGAVERIESMLADRNKSSGELAWVLAEIVGYGPAFDVGILAVRLFTKGIRGADAHACCARLGFRASARRDLALEDWIEGLSSTNAMRVEFAAEQLARLGAKADAALPGLEALLEAPDTRMVGTERTIRLRHKAALAVLAIAPASPIAARARAVLAGDPPRVAEPSKVPARAAARVAVLARELRDPEKRAAAAANLVALGELAVPGFVAALDPDDSETTEVVLAGLTELGPFAAAAAPHLFDRLGRLSASNHPALMRALAAVAPHCRDVWGGIGFGSSTNQLTIVGRVVTISMEELDEFHTLAGSYRVAMITESKCPLGELERLLQDPSVTMREGALAALRLRGPAAARSLPAVVAMLRASQPTLTVVEHVDQGMRSHTVSRNAEVHRLAAEAILAIAPPQDPARERANEVLGR